MMLNLSALSDKELIRYVEGRDLTELEAELVERLRLLDDALAVRLSLLDKIQIKYPWEPGAGDEVAG